MKTCSKCGETKPLTEFYKEKLRIRADCKKCTNAKCRKYHTDNRERRLKVIHEWCANNTEKKRQIRRKWAKENPHRHKYLNAKYRASVKQATPKWFEKDKVDLVYQKADELGFEVDHVVPITSDIVCGLHCWYNLQLLDQPLNGGKRNYHWPDMP